jgi:hypothetical protein
MKFDAEQVKQIQTLVASGFPESLAQTAVAAKTAGMENAVETTASFVAALAKNGKLEEAEVEANKIKLKEQLKSLAGLRDFPSIQKSIALKRQLSRLGD